MTFREEQIDYIEKARRAGVSDQEISAYLLEDFQIYAKKTKLIFQYLYCDRYENEIRGRVGKTAGWRTGTQAFMLIPANKRPRNRSTNTTAERYYDFGRMNWRAFRKNYFIVISAFLNKKTGKYEDTPEKAGLKRDTHNMNHLFEYRDIPETAEEVQKRAEIRQKEEIKRDKQIKMTAAKKKQALETISKALEDGLISQQDYNSILLNIKEESLFEKIQKGFVNLFNKIFNNEQKGDSKTQEENIKKGQQETNQRQTEIFSNIEEEYRRKIDSLTKAYLSNIDSILKDKTLSDVAKNDLIESAHIVTNKQKALLKKSIEQQKNDLIKAQIEVINKAFNEDLIDSTQYYNILNKVKELKKPKRTQFSNAIVYNKEGKILFIKRSNLDSFEPGKWALPGGGIDEGEEPSDACLRELKEETNLTGSKIVFAQKWITEDKMHLYYYYVTCDKLDPIILDEENDNYQWMSLSEWLSADLLLDLKDQLLEFLPTQNLNSINKSMKPKDKIKLVMKEFKNGTLKSSSGELVTDKKQALAIALSEAQSLNKGEDNLDDLIEEHKKLIDVLESPSHKDDVKEAKKQTRELYNYQKEKESISKGKKGSKFAHQIGFDLNSNKRWARIRGNEHEIAEQTSYVGETESLNNERDLKHYFRQLELQKKSQQIEPKENKQVAANLNSSTDLQKKKISVKNLKQSLKGGRYPHNATTQKILDEIYLREDENGLAEVSGRELTLINLIKQDGNINPSQFGTKN